MSFQSREATIINPETNRRILVGGPTYQLLIARGIIPSGQQPTRIRRPYYATPKAPVKQQPRKTLVLEQHPEDEVKWNAHTQQYVYPAPSPLRLEPSPLPSRTPTPSRSPLAMPAVEQRKSGFWNTIGSFFSRGNEPEEEGDYEEEYEF